MAGSRIKGITVEIGGDVTGLEKALLSQKQDLDSNRLSTDYRFPESLTASGKISAITSRTRWMT